MSDEQLVQARAEVSQLFSSANLEFLRKRSKQVASMQAAISESEPSSDTYASETGGSVSQVKGVKLPIDVDPSWVHMNVVEKDKLEWIGDLPEPTEQQLRGARQFQVRFNFDGSLIPLGLALPTHLGLHHHGDQQQFAGYTLSELSLWIRSAVPQQRILALDVLAAIVQRCVLVPSYLDWV